MTTQALRLKVIVGSTRPKRAADRVLPWVLARARAHGPFDVELLDLRDWPLPFFGEHITNVGDIRNPTYSDPIVKAWNDKIREADAFLVITPEYLHSIPGVLKNALDSVYLSFGLRNKPMSGISYSISVAGGTRALEHLADMAIEQEAVPLRNTVIVSYVQNAFDEQQLPKDPLTDGALTVLLDDLAWWAALLAKGRAEGELPPAGQRSGPAPAPAPAAGPTATGD